MKLFFYELRKSFLRKHVIVMLILLSVLDVVKIGLDKYQGSIDSLYLENKEQREAFEQLYKKTKGKFTDSTLQFITGEEERLGEIYDKRLNYNAPGEVTYCGNLYEDYRILEVYIAKEFHYMQEYEAYSNEITALAADNIAYYKDKGNLLKVRENKYIADNYSNRSVKEFYRTDSIMGYLNSYFSTILIIFMCFLGVAPVFGAEYDCKMHYILLTSKRGGLNSTLIKILSSLLFSWIMVLWFFVLDITTYQIFFGLEGLHNPVWAIQEFKESFLNCSIQTFLLHEVLLKLLAVMSVCMVILFLSLLLKKMIYVSLGFLILLAGWYVAGNFTFSFSRWKMMLALWNPVTLFRSLNLYQGFHYMEFGSRFLLESTMCIIGNVVIAAVVTVLILLVKRRAEKCG